MATQTIVDPTKYKGRVLLAAILGYAYDGVDIMVIALSLPIILGEWGITMVQGGFVVTAMLVGASLGGYVFGPIADKFGRKKALVWCILFFGITTGLAGFSQNYLQLAALRFLAGLGLGAEWALGATLLAEFTPAEKRGKANSYMQCGWPLGFGLAIVFQMLLVPEYGWQALYFAGTTAAFVALYIQIFVPESPSWVKMNEARKAGGAAAGPKPKMIDLLKGETRGRFLWVTCICTFALIAYWAVNTWLPTILSAERGMNIMTQSNYLLGLQAVSIPCTLAAGVIADKIGKGNLIVIGAIGAAVTLFIWLGFPREGNDFFAWGLVNWGIASFMWATLAAFLAEQFPLHIRAFGIASAFSTGRLITTVVPMILGAIAASTGLTTAMSFVAAGYLLAGLAAFMLKSQKAHF